MEDKKIKINKERKTPEEIFNKVEQDKKTLNDEYYGNKTLMTNYGNFALNIKKDINKDKKITTEDILILMKVSCLTIIKELDRFLNL